MQLLKYCMLALVIALAASCAPQRTYRVPIPPSGAPPSSARVPPAPPAPVAPPAPPMEPVRKPVPQEGKIREQDIRAKSPTPAPASKDVKDPRSSGEATSAPTAPPLADDSSLLAKITPGVSPQRAASLRVTDEGRKLLDAGEPAKAMSRLERTIVIDSTNGYGYFYLAKAQYRLGHYQESLNLLEVAQSRLSGELFWLAEVHALRGENYRALGQAPRAEASYHQSLRLNSGNRTASDGLARMTGETPAAAK
ncbi:MAG TPA: hypothetical protein VLM90_13955 [Candidatus Deferrimicrobium sp.]|nr:hypothetical protein [Candidatus Deferrimicrobium sp.]